jgi:Anaphase-promoting complex subunit 1
MLSIENGTLLNFDRLLNDNIPGPTETCIIDPNVPQARGCLSTCNVRLSFGELDHAHNSRPVEQPRTASDGLRLPHLGKYDKLMLKELYCHESLESSSRMVGNVTEDESRTVFGRGTHGGLPGVPAPTEQFKIRSCPAVGAFLSGDEFVIIRDNFLLRGRGIEGKYRVVEEIHRKEKPIIDSVWCTFRHQERHVRPEHATVTPVLEAFEPLDALCIAEQRKIHVHSVNGEQYSHASSFPIRKLWSFPLGLLVERDTRVVSNLTSVLGYPNLFTATTHLEELAPVLFLGSTQSPEKTAILIHPDSVVAGVSDELPLVLFFEPHGNVHSLWLARSTTAEEMEAAVELIGKVVLS